jgi:hypothetical protein
MTKKVMFNFLGDFELRFHHALLDFQRQETKTIGLPSAKKIVRPKNMEKNKSIKGKNKETKKT